MKKQFYLFLFGLNLSTWVFSQGIHKPESLADFTVNDTVCFGFPAIIHNLSQGATTYFWRFGSGNAGYFPTAGNIGDPSNYDYQAKYIIAVQDGNQLFTFYTSPGNQKLVRSYWGAGFASFPTQVTDLGNFGMLDDSVKGIQVKNDNGSWYGFIMDKSKLIRLDFGNTLTNVPVATSFTIPAMTTGSGLVIFQDGMDWYGFCADCIQNEIFRIDFGTSLTTTPQFTVISNTAGLYNYPASMAIGLDNGIWYLFVTNAGSATFIRLAFTLGLMQIPSGTIYGANSGGSGVGGITIIQDCGKFNGYMTNLRTDGRLDQLNFENGLGGNITSFQTQDFGIMNVPYGISDIIRVGDSLYGFVADYGSSTITRLIFPHNNGVVIPFYGGPDPPPIYYLATGNYNIELIINEGTTQQSMMCKNIVVVDAPVVHLGADRTICVGGSVTLDPGTGYTSYLWSTGETTRTITVDSTGIYILRVTNEFGCPALDTVVITVVHAVRTNIDTGICFNQRYFAQGGWQTTNGIYHDTLASYLGCDSIVQTTLRVIPRPALNLGKDTSLCPGNTITLNASVRDTTSYLWQDGSTDSIYLVTKSGVYWVHLTVDGCISGDTIRIENCPYYLWFPSAFSPNGDGKNDTYKPVGLNIIKFKMEVFDRWGTKIFESNDINAGWDGKISSGMAPVGFYTYIVEFEVEEGEGKVHRDAGVFSLIR